MAEKAVALLALAIIVLLGALAFGPFADDLNGTQTFSTELEDGTTTEVSDGLLATVENTSTTGTANASITLQDADSGDLETLTINESATGSFNVSNSTINATPTNIQADGFVVVNFEVPRTFGWSDSAIVLSDRLPDIIVLMIGVSIVAALAAVIRQ